MPTKFRHKHKFGAVPTIRKGFRFASKLEARCAAWLDILVKAKKIVFYLKQIPFYLPGGKNKYVCDFQVFWTDGHVSFIDAKGKKTDMFIFKKKQVEALYPVEIEIWEG